MTYDRSERFEHRGPGAPGPTPTWQMHVRQALASVTAQVARSVGPATVEVLINGRAVATATVTEPGVPVTVTGEPLAFIEPGDLLDVRWDVGDSEPEGLRVDFEWMGAP